MEASQMQQSIFRNGVLYLYLIPALIAILLLLEFVSDKSKYPFGAEGPVAESWMYESQTRYEAVCLFDALFSIGVIIAGIQLLKRSYPLRAGLLLPAYLLLLWLQQTLINPSN